MRVGFAAKSYSDAVDQPHHGHFGVARIGDGTANRGIADEDAIRSRSAAAVELYVAKHNRAWGLPAGCDASHSFLW